MTEEKRGPGRPPKEATVACIILRDFWDEDGIRHKAGETVELGISAAMDGIESGSLSRVK